MRDEALTIAFFFSESHHRNHPFLTVNYKADENMHNSGYLESLHLI